MIINYHSKRCYLQYHRWIWNLYAQRLLTSHRNHRPQKNYTQDGSEDLFNMKIRAEKKRLIERHCTVIEHLNITTTVTTKQPLIIHCMLCIITIWSNDYFRILTTIYVINRRTRHYMINWSITSLSYFITYHHVLIFVDLTFHVIVSSKP